MDFQSWIVYWLTNTRYQIYILLINTQASFIKLWKLRGKNQPSFVLFLTGEWFTINIHEYCHTRPSGQTYPILLEGRQSISFSRIHPASRPPTLEYSISQYLSVRSLPDLILKKGCVKYAIICGGGAALVLTLSLTHLLFIQNRNPEI